MGTNPLVAWLAGRVDHVTAWEIAAALVGIGAVLFSLWGIIDNVFDMREVKISATPGGPRWIWAVGLLVAHSLFLLGFLGYLHVALTAAYLPNRVDIPTSAMVEVAVMRFLYGVFGLLGIVTLRMTRLLLRRLTRAQWAPLFGEAARYQQLYHQAQARVRGLEAEVATHRAEKHAEKSKRAGVEAYAQILQRQLARHGIEVPLAETFPLESEEPPP